MAASGDELSFAAFRPWLRSAPLVICIADFDCDSFTTGVDFDAFMTAFEAGDPAADVDADGSVTGSDFGLFVAAFESGC